MNASLTAAASDAQHGQVDKARSELEHARDLAHNTGDPGSEGITDLYAGLLDESQHTPTGYETAVKSFRASLPLLTAAGNREGQAVAAQGLGDSLEALGRFDQARNAYKIALALPSAAAEKGQRARTLIGLSMAERALKDSVGARTHAEAALPLLKPEEGQARVTALMQLGTVCDDQSDWACGADSFFAAADGARAAANAAIEHAALMRGALDAMRQMKSLSQADKPAKAAEQALRAAVAYHGLGDAEAEVTARLASAQYLAATGEWVRADRAQMAALAAASGDASRARVLLALASTANLRGDYGHALERAEAALPLLSGPDLAPKRALLLLIAGNAAGGVHDTARALGYLTQAEGLSAANSSVHAAAIAAESEIRTEQGDPARGAELAREAMRLHDQLGDTSATNKDRSDLGLALSAEGRRAEALAVYEVALANARAAKEPQQQAVAFTDIGTVHLAFGDFTQAIDLFRQGQEVAHRVGDRDTEATAAVHLGLAEHARGDEKAALAAINVGIAIRRDSGDSRGEAIDMCDLALVDSETGRVQDALNLYEQARARFATMSDSYNEASALNGIGTVYRRLGALEEARRYFQQAAAIHERDHDDESRSVVLNNLAVVEQSLDELDDALEDYQRALAIQTALGGRVEQVTLLNGIAMVHDARGEREAALDSLTRALQLAVQVGSPEAEALALHNRGTVRERAGDRDGALDDLRRALPLWRHAGAAQNEAITMGVIARIESAEGRTEEALTTTQTAIKLYESQRGQISSEDLRASWLTGATSTYELRTELLMELDERNPGKGYAVQALEATEAARARSLLDLLREAHADVLGHANAAQADSLRRIRSALNVKAVQAAKVDREGPDGAALAHELDDLLAEQDRVDAAIRVGNPAYASLTAPAPMTAAAIQALLDPQTVLLDFALGKKRSFVWLITPDAVRAFGLPPRDTVQQAAAAMQAAMTGPPDPHAPAALGGMLLDQIATAIEGKRLVIVADAPLQGQVPFAALMVPSPSAEQGQPLVQFHEIVIEPSAAALASIRQATVSRPHPAGAIAVFADPVVSSNDPRLPALGVTDVPAVGAGLDLPRLPATRSEADAILELPRPGAALARFGFDATREAAQDPALAAYAVLHFAVHGATDTRFPELSGLVLSMRSPDGAPRDGYLRLADVYGLSLPADLVVLSACGSGLGRSVDGEGLVGLSRGFLYAGAASVVATLWDIQDDSTALIMTHFYAAMWGPEHLRPSAALRAAQRAMIADKRWSAPRYWAGFVMQGEWR